MKINFYNFAQNTPFMSNQIKGTVIAVSPVTQISEKLRKREVVIETYDQYPQKIAFEFVNERVDLVTESAKGTDVSIHFDIRGREWADSKTGIVKYFISLNAWKIDWLGTGQPSAFTEAEKDSGSKSATPVSADMPLPAEGDLPF